MSAATNLCLLRQTYRNALETALHATAPALNAQTLAVITPHLNDAQRQELLTRVGNDERVYIATPALEVANSYFIVALTPGFTPSTDSANRSPFPPTISIIKAKRCTVVVSEREALFAQEALDFARNNWGGQLGAECDGLYQRIVLEDQALKSRGLPVLPLSLTVVHCASSASAEADSSAAPSSNLAEALVARCTRIFAGEIESIEHLGWQRTRYAFKTWELTEVPARIVSHLVERRLMAA
jgi:hypothetical protein